MVAETGGKRAGVSMVGNIVGSFGRSSGGQTKTVNRLIMLALCTALVSGCTGQKLAAPLAKQGLGKDNQQTAVSEKSEPAQTRQVDPITTASVQPKSPFEMEAEASAEEDIVMGPFPQLGTDNHPNGSLIDNTVTGSVEPSISSEGEGRTKLERITNTVSASCRRILAEAGIETTLLRSPTLNGSFNSDEDINLGASYDLLDLHRASLTEELAVVRCARDDAAAKLAQLLVTSSHSHSQAGYRAKAEHLKASRSEIKAIKTVFGDHA